MVDVVAERSDDASDDASNGAASAVVVLDPAMSEIFALAERLAASTIPVLITGETGCGKELIAAALHDRSPRARRALIAINCAALHTSIVESELFGHEKGAFSGAVASQIGKIEAATGSTLFLDEVGELPLAIQAKLLRVLELQRFTRLGDTRERAVNVRIIAATNRDLEHEVEIGRFRKDLYFRLAAATIHLPPLRERRCEISTLARTFLEAACMHAKRRAMNISSEAMSLLEAHAWPGNVRELKNLMYYVAAVTTEDTVELAHIRGRLRSRTVADPRHAEPQVFGRAEPPVFQRLADELQELEMRRLREALATTDGNSTAAARLLGMPVRTFFEKANQYKLERRHVGGPIAREMSPTVEPSQLPEAAGDELWNDDTLVLRTRNQGER